MGKYLEKFGRRLVNAPFNYLGKKTSDPTMKLSLEEEEELIQAFKLEFNIRLPGALAWIQAHMIPEIALLVSIALIVEPRLEKLQAQPQPQPGAQA